MKHILFAIALSFFVLSCQQEPPRQKSEDRPPNFVIIFADDLGYGDLGIFGSTIKTPELDRMAFEGQKWNNFYAAASVCTPSRAGLQTGRLPIRSGMCSDNRRVLFPDSDGGLPESEITIAKKLKEAGYATAAVGKWHLGHLPQYLPTSHGYDSYYGIPYSNDMDRIESVDHYESCVNPKNEYFKIPLMENEKVLSREVDQALLTKNYTEKAVKFINENKDKPFLLYLAHSMPHVPLFRSEAFRGISERGIYGDVIAEIDWSVGQIRKTLEENDISENTLVVFTSDNGPWVIFNEQAGSAGMLYGAKGTGYEGGMREPTVFWWPGRLKEGTISEMGSTLDLYPTIVSLAGLDLESDRTYDGYDLTDVLLNQGSSERDEMYYYHGTRVFAARKGGYKLLFYKNNPDGYPEQVEPLEKLQLFNLAVDPGEQYDVADERPDIVEEIQEMVQNHVASVEEVASQLDKRIEQAEASYEEKSL
jgi:arylsulfatase A-like enzyme